MAVPRPRPEGNATGRTFVPRGVRRALLKRAPMPRVFFSIRKSFTSSAAADLGDQHDLAVGLQRREIGVLEYLAVYRDGHALVDLRPKAGIAPVELGDEAAHRVRLDIEFGDTARQPAGGDSGHQYVGHVYAPFSSFPRQAGIQGESYCVCPWTPAFAGRRAGRLTEKTTPPPCVAGPAHRARRAAWAATSAGRAYVHRPRRRSRWRRRPSAARSAPRRHRAHQTGDAGLAPRPSPRRSSAGRRRPGCG